jgi:hypothetical protein
MLGRKRRLSAIVTSAILVALTVSVFAKLRDYGPESTLRRFHVAALSNDLATMNATIKEGSNEGNVYWLRGFLRELSRQGTLPRIIGQRGDVNSVAVEVAYILPNTTQGMVMVWKVDRVGRTWKINVDKTAQAIRESMGQP